MRELEEIKKQKQKQFRFKGHIHDKNLNALLCQEKY